MGQLQSGSTADAHTNSHAVITMNIHSIKHRQRLLLITAILFTVSLTPSIGHDSVHAVSIGETRLPSCPDTWHVGSMALSPVDDTLFFAYHSSSLWRTTDAGVSWRLVYRPFGPTGGLESLTITPPSLPTNPTLYLRHQYRTIAGPNFGLARSTDAGNTWQQRTTCSPNCWGVFPTNRPDTIFAARVEPAVLVEFGRGVLRSDDGGLTWQVLWDASGVRSLFVSPAFADDQTVLAATWSWQERPPFWLMASTDGGRTWASRENGLGDSPVEGLVFSPEFARDHVLFAQTSNRLFRSRDAGLNWETVLDPGSDTRITSVVLSPDYVSDHTLFLTTYGSVMVSYDDARNWYVLVSGGSNYDLIVGRQLASQRPERERHDALTTDELSSRHLSADQRQYFPMAGVFGVRSRPLSLFLSTPGNRTSYYRSQDGGAAWNCLIPPPESR